MQFFPRKIERINRPTRHVLLQNQRRLLLICLTFSEHIYNVDICHKGIFFIFRMSTPFLWYPGCLGQKSCYIFSLKIPDTPILTPSNNSHIYPCFLCTWLKFRNVDIITFMDFFYVRCNFPLTHFYECSHCAETWHVVPFMIQIPKPIKHAIYLLWIASNEIKLTVDTWFLVQNATL